MGNIEIFASAGNGIITVLSLLIFVVTTVLVARGKLPYKKGLSYINAGIVFEFITVYTNFQMNIEYAKGEQIDILVFIQLLLALVSMLCLAAGAFVILINNQATKAIIVGLGSIGSIASVYFVFFFPDNYIISNMQAIFIFSGFLIMSIAFWSQLHRRHATGFLTAASASTLITIIIFLKNFLGISSWEIINSWYISPLFYNIMAVAYIAMNADFLANKLENARREIVKYNLRIEEIIKSSPFPIILSRLSDDRIILANKNAIKLFGIDERELEHYRLKDFFADSDNRTVLTERLEEEKEVSDFEVLVKSYNGDTPFWLLTSATTIDYNYDIVLYAAFQDITSRKNREDLLKNQAIRDPLTSLYNRRYFEEEVKKRISQAQQSNGIYSVLMSDIDFFKRVNDTYGHKIGDKVLIELASACDKALRDGDIVARYGGEEFVIYLADVDAQMAKVVAERLRNTISELRVPTDDGRTVQFTISIGISSSKISDNIDTLIKTADEALYKAKQNGRNRVEVFCPEDLKGLDISKMAMHKDENSNRHPIFEKEESEEISLLDGVGENKIIDNTTKIENNKPAKES